MNKIKWRHVDGTYVDAHAWIRCGNDLAAGDGGRWWTGKRIRETRGRLLQPLLHLSAAYRARRAATQRGAGRGWSTEAAAGSQCCGGGWTWLGLLREHSGRPSCGTGQRLGKGWLWRVEVVGGAMQGTTDTALRCSSLPAMRPRPTLAFRDGGGGVDGLLVAHLVPEPVGGEDEQLAVSTHVHCRGLRLRHHQQLDVHVADVPGHGQRAWRCSALSSPPAALVAAAGSPRGGLEVLSPSILHFSSLAMGSPEPPLPPLPGSREAAAAEDHATCHTSNHTYYVVRVTNW